MTKSDLITLFKLTVIGFIIAALSYLFHPEVGEFTFMMGGHPISQLNRSGYFGGSNL
jgi:hypothetical protein